jgi:ornithine cyclodeaminase/alanine dehydrogenase
MTQDSTPAFLSRGDLEALNIPSVAVVDAIEDAFRAQDRGEVWCAPKAALTPGDGRYIMATLAAGDAPPYVVVKSIVLNPENAKRELPQINGLIMLLDSATGLPVAVMDGNWVTEIRTAGLSALAAKSLARPDSKSIAFVGCGAQARSHLEVFSALYPLEEAVAYGRGRANIDRLCSMAEGLGLSARAEDDPRAALAGADIIVTSVTFTELKEPFLDAGWVKEGCFAAVTDLAAPWDKKSFSIFDRFVIDDVEQEAAMPEKLADPSVISGDLAGLVLGRVKPREDAAERTAFVFRAHPLGDFALSALAYDKSKR